MRINLTFLIPTLLAAPFCLAQDAPRLEWPGRAQAPAPEAAADRAQPASGGYSLGALDFSGSVDAYYSLNFNHPAGRNNQLRNFDVKANQFSLNYAKMVLEHAADPIGFRADFGFGRTADIIHAAEASPSGFRYLQQAYVSVKPSQARGFQADFGQFVTSAGAEVIETQNNWNYSRSLLFAWAIPYYHFGVRATMPVNSRFSVGAQLVNGWNNLEDNNSGKTVGLTAAVTTSKFSWYHNYYAGPEKTDTNQGARRLYDMTLLLTPHSRASMYLNFDYGADRQIAGGNSRWVGVAGAARVSVNERFAVAPRLEWFHDVHGFATGTAQRLKEFTLTGEYRMQEGFIGRLEYRRDWSDQPFFDRGASPASIRNQDTVLLGFVVYFAPKR
jgi:Putative beta-barrel porin-2, OmpL-like. bbp2